MLYFFGAMGFALGFIVGLVVINMFLRHYSKKDLIKDKSLHWTYGLAVWVFAAIGTALGVWFYDRSIF